MGERWLPADHPYPQRVELPTGHHLRPISADDVAIDYPAVMGSRQSLWQRYGQDWRWPPADMTFEGDRMDLERHAREMEARESFNYAILDELESQLLGCVYIDPPYRPADAGFDAVFSWWLVDGTGPEVAEPLGEFLTRWATGAWPFSHVRVDP